MEPKERALWARRAAEAVDEAEVIRLTRELVRIPSVYRPCDPEGNERRCALWVRDVLADLGLDPRVDEVAPGRPNVVADWSPSGQAGPTLLFEGHTDVVTAGDPSAWSHPPFGAELVDGRIYGRGANDMKGGLAAALAALRALKQAGLPLPGQVRLAALVDEEGMMEGVKTFIRAGLARDVDGAIICEPEQNEVCLTQKGAMRVDVRFAGRMAHGAMPDQGANPIPWAARFVERVAALEKEFRQELGRHPHLGPPTLTPTILQAPAGGEAQVNVVPGSARVALDIRTVPRQDHGLVRNRLEAILAGLQAEDRDCRASLEVLEERPWTETDPHETVVLAVEAACTLVGQPVVRGGVPGATDGTFLAAWADVPIVTLGPGNRYLPHQVDEYVEVDELVRAARIYAAAAVLFLTEPVNRER
ncbi:M20 family metallopeptidase [Limnochorda pilosa]|uniref:Probable succinyl-diaminopimelate desuccinylase n=1 Tax=Limnochorda pilosa TaxID=1555112 RepID=A0A0K2SH95_LIMPI|nr:M20 family metallopeptidase [Limnochorda pilosa]BAS26465.1 peptidase M20 [Limnochorda pilosa]